MSDKVEVLRRKHLRTLNEELFCMNKNEARYRYGDVWDTEELARDFEVIGFLAPFVAVRRKSDNRTGSLEFQHMPRFYFNWKEDDS